MAGLNKVFILGRLGKDPEIKTLTNSVVARISVATSEKVKEKDVTTWHTIIIWGKLAELCGKNLKKGSQALFEGKIQTRSYESKDGKTQYVFEIVANNVQFLEAKKSEDQHSDDYFPWDREGA